MGGGGELGGDDVTVRVPPSRPSIYRAMLRVVWKELLLSAMLRLIVLIWEFSQPLLLQ